MMGNYHLFFLLCFILFVFLFYIGLFFTDVTFDWPVFGNLGLLSQQEQLPCSGDLPTILLFICGVFYLVFYLISVKNNSASNLHQHHLLYGLKSDSSLTYKRIHNQIILHHNLYPSYL